MTHAKMATSIKESTSGYVRIAVLCVVRYCIYSANGTVIEAKRTVWLPKKVDFANILNYSSTALHAAAQSGSYDILTQNFVDANTLSQTDASALNISTQEVRLLLFGIWRSDFCCWWCCFCVCFCVCFCFCFCFVFFLLFFFLCDHEYETQNDKLN